MTQPVEPLPPAKAVSEELKAKCGRCGHAYSFHRKQRGVPCKAMGCKGCEGFVSPDVGLDPE